MMLEQNIPGGWPWSGSCGRLKSWISLEFLEEMSRRSAMEMPDGAQFCMRRGKGK